MILTRLICCSFLFISLFAQEIPFTLPETSELNKIKSGVIETELGNIVFELYPEKAPWHVANLKYLSDIGYFKNQKIPVVQNNSLVQVGQFTKKTAKAAWYLLPPEFSSMKHELGTLTMSRYEDSTVKNPKRSSVGGQFWVMLNIAPHMDGNYTIFGKVVKGFNILRDLKVGDKINDIKVFVRDH